MKEDLKIYRYINRRDSNLGSIVIVVADSLENAKSAISKELITLGYVFDDGAEIIEWELTPGFVIHSDSGDCYF